LNSRAEKFWDFSLRLYANEEVASLCLQAQDQFDIDVNMLLFCCWQAAGAQHTDPAIFREAVNYSHKWKNQVVQPLRNSRKWMKSVKPISPELRGQYDRLRQQIADSELAAEKIQQEQLQRLVDSKVKKTTNKMAATDSVADITHSNLEYYLKLAAIALDHNRVSGLANTLAKYV